MTSTRVVRAVPAVIGGLVLMHLLRLAVGERSWQMERLFDLDREGTVAAWFSSLLLAANAAAAWGCARLTHEASSRRAWTLLALMLLFMSCDEIAMLHETAARIVVIRMLRLTPSPTSLWNSWPLVLGPVIAVAIGWLGWQLRGELRRFPATRRRLLWGAGIFFFGAAGLELFWPLWYQRETLRWLMQAQIIVEETLEMVGACVVLTGLLSHQTKRC